MTTFPSLDIPTLFVVSAAVVGSSGLLLILARGRDQGSRPQLVWGAAMVVGAVGIILLAMAPRVDWPARILGNVAILVGTGLSWSGARIFGGRRPNLLALAAGPAAWLLLDGLGWGRDHPAPTILSFLAGAAYTLGAAYELWRSPEERRTTRNAAVLLLLLHATLYVLQAAATAVAPARFLSDDLIVLLMLEALLHTTWMAFLFLALIKERAELHANQELRTLATYDQLTGLGNRRHFDQTLRQEFRRAARGQTPLGLLMIDVDHFKSFNDTYGHPEGDESLRSVAGAIQAACST